MPRRYISPLRYPGGKAPMAPWLADMFEAQAGLMDIEIWLEPFAGGAGAALGLLEADAVGEVWLVDKNPGIAAFFSACVADGEELAARVERTCPDLELYDRCREQLSRAGSADPLELAYAAFIVNRCSRSGIVAPTSGPMGGRTSGSRYALNGRFNAPELADRIRHISSFAPRLRVFHGDGIAFVEQANGSGIADEMVTFVDPPYIREGNRLYANGFGAADHQRLADALNGTDARWMLTYDDESAVTDKYYPDRRVLSYAIRNTANRARVAREYAVFSDNLDLRFDDEHKLLRYGDTAWVRAA